MTQKQLDEQFKKVIENTGCEIKVENKKWKPVVVITKQESDEELLAGLEDIWTWLVEDPDWLKEKEKQMKEKEKQMKKQEKIKYIALQSLNFNKWIVYLLKNYKKLSIVEVNDKLEELDKIISNYEVIWDERERSNILEWLNTLKQLYIKNKEIVNNIEKIIKKVKLSKLNSNIA